MPVQGPGTATVVNPVGGTSPGRHRPRRQPRRPDRPDLAEWFAVSDFAEGFDTLSAFDSSSFVDSSLSITFSADGTTLYASDNDAIWQFKTVTSLASASSGSLIGLNDLRSLGVPYEGQGTAVAVVDTGVDANNPNFRGRVTTGTNIITNGPGNDDLAGVSTGGTTTGTGGTGMGAPAPGAPTGPTGTSVNQTIGITTAGHGTMIAGVIAQFVPQATIELRSTSSTRSSATSPGRAHHRRPAGTGAPEERAERAERGRDNR